MVGTRRWRCRRSSGLEARDSQLGPRQLVDLVGRPSDRVSPPFHRRHRPDAPTLSECSGGHGCLIRLLKSDVSGIVRRRGACGRVVHAGMLLCPPMQSSILPASARDSLSTPTSSESALEALPPAVRPLRADRVFELEEHAPVSDATPPTTNEMSATLSRSPYPDSSAHSAFAPNLTVLRTARCRRHMALEPPRNGTARLTERAHVRDEQRRCGRARRRGQSSRTDCSWLSVGPPLRYALQRTAFASLANRSSPHAAAHEVAHLIIPQYGHSSEGLMKAVWDVRDYLMAAQGRLRFSEQQAARIRAALAP
jgi:hypothetical protein